MPTTTALRRARHDTTPGTQPGLPTLQPHVPEAAVDAPAAIHAIGRRATTPIRMLIVVSEAPPVVSGVSRSVDRLRRDLRELGVEADVISANEIARVSFGEVRLSSFAFHWPRISRLLGQYDVINLHGPAPTLSDVFLAAFRATPMRDRPPLVYTHHSAIDLAGLGPLCRLYNAVTSRLATRADRIIVTSPSYADEISVENGPPVDVVPWGVDAATFGDVDRVARAAGAPLRVLFVGQLRPYKGVPVLLDAIGDSPSVHLTVAGSGPLRALVEGRAAAMDNVTFVGRVADDDLPALYARHDVIVLPSTTRAEAFGLVLLEGMAAGCVPVASDLPGVRDVAGPTGLLVRPSDALALRAVLEDLAADPARLEALGVASRLRAESLTWGRAAEAYAGSIQAAVRDGRRRTTRHLLPAGLRDPERAIAQLAHRFDASWWSLLVFPGAGAGFPAASAANPVAWGRAAAARHVGPSPVASYVAHQRRALLLGPDAHPEIPDMLNRRDIGSAIAVPVEVEGGVAAITLSRAMSDARRFTQEDLDLLSRLVAA